MGVGEGGGGCFKIFVVLIFYSFHSPNFDYFVFVSFFLKQILYI